MAVATPEGVTLEFTLAGVGSRFAAAFVDGLVQLGLIIGVLLLGWGLSNVGPAGLVVSYLGVFVVLFGYDILWETFASGRTPGKRWNGLRVVKVGGGPVTFLTSAIRNLLRLIDIMPGFYLVGIVTILATPKNQRLGDLAAGTIVVRERTVGPAPAGAQGAASWTGWSGSGSGSGSGTGSGTAGGLAGRLSDGGVDIGAWDVSAVTADEVAAIRQFLSRRTSITGEARKKLARELAGRLRPKVIAPQETMGPETFLEAVVRAKSERL